MSAPTASKHRNTRRGEAPRRNHAVRGFVAMASILFVLGTPLAAGAQLESVTTTLDPVLETTDDSVDTVTETVTGTTETTDVLEPVTESEPVQTVEETVDDTLGTDEPDGTTTTTAPPSPVDEVDDTVGEIFSRDREAAAPPGPTDGVPPAPTDGPTGGATTAGDAPASTNGGGGVIASSQPALPGGSLNAVASVAGAKGAGADHVDVPLGPRSTREIVEMLREAGASETVITNILSPFPVAPGPAYYSNDWGAPRHDHNGPRQHKGTDIFADRGTPIISPIQGVVTNLRHDTAIGGNSMRVTAPDGSFYYFAHLDGFAPSITNGSRVNASTVLGFVGTTGNAKSTPPHLHFEVHPGGGEAVPPLPFLDQWIQDAGEEAQAWVASAAAGAAAANVPAAESAEPFGVPGLAWASRNSTLPTPAVAVAVLSLLGILTGLLWAATALPATAFQMPEPVHAFGRRMTRIRVAKKTPAAAAQR